MPPTPMRRCTSNRPIFVPVRSPGGGMGTGSSREVAMVGGVQQNVTPFTTNKTAVCTIFYDFIGSRSGWTATNRREDGYNSAIHNLYFQIGSQGAGYCMRVRYGTLLIAL